jgi:hypothetical protein
METETPVLLGTGVFTPVIRRKYKFLFRTDGWSNGLNLCIDKNKQVLFQEKDLESNGGRPI